MPSIARPQRLEADLLSPAEVESLIRACSKRAPTGIRNRALLALLWRCGLRLGEALALADKDVNLDEYTVTVQNGKGGKRRVVGLDVGTALLVDHWRTRRKKLRVPARAPLFCTLKGSSIDQSYVRHLLKRLSRKAGVERRAHAHGLRHRYAVDLVKEGADLLTVRDLLGHSSAATTQTYLSRIGAGEAIDFARKREWNLATVR